MGVVVPRALFLFPDELDQPRQAFAGLDQMPQFLLRLGAVRYGIHQVDGDVVTEAQAGPAKGLGKRMGGDAKAFRLR